MNKAYSLTPTDIEEISRLADIRDMWGAENAAEMAAKLRHEIYAAKFNFVCGIQPGYVGNLYILHGDALGEPLTLVRDAEHNLVVC